MKKKKWYPYELSKKEQLKQKKIADKQEAQMNEPTVETMAKAVRFLADVYIDEVNSKKVNQ